MCNPCGHRETFHNISKMHALYIGISVRKIAKPATISLISITGNVLAIILNRLMLHLDQGLLPVQDSQEASVVSGRNGLTWYLLPSSYKKNARNISCVISTSIYTMGSTIALLTLPMLLTLSVIRDSGKL